MTRRPPPSSKRLAVLVLALSLAAPTALAAPKLVKAPAVLAERNRDAQAARAVQVIVAQSQIETNIELGMIPAAANGGGLLGGLIITSMDDRAKQLGSSLRARADADAAPLRAALKAMDVDTLALTTTRTALAQPAWFRAGTVTLIKTATPAANTLPGQTATVAYHYSLSPDFTKIQVVADVVLVHKEAGSKPAVPLYAQRISSVVQLEKRSYEQHENAAAWAANDGERAKQALTIAFARLEGLIPYALGLSQAELEALSAKDGERVFAGGFYGRRIRQDGARPGDILLWSKGLIHVATLVNGAAASQP